MAGLKPRLRFDKVAVRLVAQVSEAVGSAAPADLGVIFAVTAPILQPARTAQTLIALVGRLLSDGPGPERREDLFGNAVRVRIVRRGDPASPPVAGFVHNPEPDPAALLDEAQARMAG